MNKLFRRKETRPAENTAENTAESIAENAAESTSQNAAESAAENTSEDAGKKPRKKLKHGRPGKPWLRFVITLLVAAMFLSAAYGLLIFVSVSHMALQAQEGNALRKESISNAVNAYLENSDHALLEMEKNHQLSVRLNATAVRPLISDGVIDQSMLPEQSFIVEDVNGSPAFPDGIELFADASEYLSTAKAGAYSPVRVTPPLAEEETEAILFMEHLRDRYYYAEWMSISDMFREVDAKVSEEDFYHSLESAYHADIISFVDYDGQYVFTYRSDAMKKYESPEDLPVSLDKLIKEGEGYEDFGDNYYSYFLINFGDLDHEYSLFLTNTGDLYQYSVEQVRVIIFLIAVILLTIIVLYFSVRKFVLEHILSTLQKRKYSPSGVLKTSALFLLIGMITVAAASVFVQSVGNLFIEISASRDLLSALETRLSDRKARDEEILQETRERYTGYAGTVSEILRRYPAFAGQGGLRRMSNLIGGQYLILFDEKGNETACSGDFRDLTLQHLDASPEGLGRLLLGGPPVVLEPAYNPVTGLTSTLIGVRYVPDGGSDYEILVLAMDPSVMQSSSQAENVGSIYSSLTVPGGLILEADPEAGIITYSSSAEMIGRTLTSLGISAQSLEDRFMNRYLIDGVSYYGTTEAWDGRSYLYLTSLDSMMSKSFPFVITAVLTMLISGIAVIFLSKWGYTKRFFEEYAVTGDRMVTGSRIEVLLANGTRKVSIDPSGRWLGEVWLKSALLPEQKVRLVVESLAGLFIAIVAYGVYAGRDAGSRSILAFIMHGEWSRGFNIFSVAAVILLSAGIFIGLFLLRVFASLICSTIGTKGETILRLVMSLAQYFGLIVLLYYAFGFLGFDTAGLLASVGFVTLAVTLGARDLVTDILAGLSIVFDGDFQVGDIVEIAGYRGKVL